MGICIDKKGHSCGTRHGLQVFADGETGKVDGFCFSCGTYVRNPYGEEVTVDEVELPPQKTEEQIQEEIDEVDEFQTLSLPTRKLSHIDLKEFGIKTSVSEEDGKTPRAMYSPVTRDGALVGYYVKTLGENSYTFSIGDTKNGDPFNWENARASGAYRLIITEGYEDAVAVSAMYRKYGDKEYKPAVISLKNGVESVNGLSKIAQEIKKKFKEVILCFDDDEVGREAIKKAMVILPMAQQVVLPYKDANECILKGAAKEAYKALRFNAHTPKNTRLIRAGDLHEKAREPTPYGELTWPFPTMNKLLRNIRLGETIYVGAGVKMGKSELLDALASHIILEDGKKVMVVKPEQENKKTYKKICGKVAGKNFDDPEVEFDYEAFDEAGESLKDSLFMIDLYQHMDWETLKQDIVSAANEGVKAVFIDPITNLTNGMQAGDANAQLAGIAQDLSAMALDLNITVFIFCHLKAPEGNLNKEARKKRYDKGEYTGLGSCPHELGGDVLSAQFAGSRAMMRSCNLMLGLEGNKDPELPEKIRSMRWLSILEDREFGNSGKVPIYWNKHTTRYKEC